MIGLYFSGTGNTRYAVERFVKAVDSTAKCFSIEEKIVDELENNELIVFGFPIYYSHAPKIVRDYIEENKSLFKGKKVFIITTKGMFGAYGVIYAAKQFKRCGAEFVGSLQLNMPDNIRDIKIMELVFNYKKDALSVKKAEKKIDKAAARFMNGSRVKNGFCIHNYLIGGLFKVLPFYPKTNKYKTAPKVDNDKCIGCGICVKCCPMQNIKLESERAVSGGKCTLCYRCFNQCPEKALTILGKKVYSQYSIEEVIK